MRFILLIPCKLDANQGHAGLTRLRVLSRLNIKSPTYRKTILILTQPTALIESVDKEFQYRHLKPCAVTKTLYKNVEHRNNVSAVAGNE